MILENINFDSAETYLYMERYINNGSPSGFTEKYTTSDQTKAKSPNKHFYLCSIEIPRPIVIQDFGEPPEFFKSWQMLVHPDMIDDHLFSICTNINKEAVLVAPTASSRTVKMLEGEGWFLKLNYKGLIGRLERQIAKNQALSAIEVTRTIVNAIENGMLPKRFYFMREVFSRIVEFPEKESFYEWGIVLREPDVYPPNGDKKILIPGFSLFSEDDFNPSDPTILTQLIRRQAKPVEDFLFEDVISPIYEAYFSLLLKCGLQLEAHAQNCLFAVNESFQIIGIVVKDAESIDKDLSLMDELNIANEYTTIEYKCLRRGQYNYQIMHSFMFDFKLGEYLITPIIEDALSNFSFDKDKLVARIKEYNNSFIRQLPADFFPKDGKWYSYSNIVHDRSKMRPYIANDDPRYR